MYDEEIFNMGTFSIDPYNLHLKVQWLAWRD